MAILSGVGPNPPVYYPETDYTIVKYMDLTKFISLLQRKSLFFCRLEKLEDQFEGKTAKPNFNDRVEFWKQRRIDPRFTPLSDEQIIQKVEEYYNFEAYIKSITCVNCWNRGDIESVALWKIYSDFNKGIMIKSSISKLVKSLAQSIHKICLSEIRYLDYDNDIMLDGSTMYPFIHKQQAYSYEAEIRLIYEVEDTNRNFDWSKQEIPEGIYIDVNLEDLIDEIIIGPYAPKWFFHLVQDILEKYCLSKEISKSKLSLI